MSNHDELLARADASHHILSRELGAAIRELRAAVLAEGGAREPVAEVRSIDAGMKVLWWKDVAREWADLPIGTKLYAASIALPPAVPADGATTWNDHGNSGMRYPEQSDLTSGQTDAGATTQDAAGKVTECCDVPIPEDQRYCPKCGWEARIREPASPLLPGLERTPSIDARWVQVQTISDYIAHRDEPPLEIESALCFAVHRAKELEREISRLKGEGRGS